ncbi:carbohydrate ABC transporter permease [Bacillus sp. V2I10]|uniref:carbohydrate ABC transporter permease n=1 Tax=Bacillus sp. V2I10 TaxID=3042276 RepID=UPI00278B3D1B|nr:sugar ABC transporter permease [Bacillus sp. V2I10]MDQ0857731.1 raffinose/stachyose/melibiose transport system permease protein [Bacillus sp. V2I10]
MNNKSFSYWAFLSLCLAALFIVLAIPLIMGIYYSFTNWDGNYVDKFVGLDNYKRLLTDEGFINSLVFTGKFAVAAVIGINVIGLALALLVTQKFKFNTALRTVFFMPNLIGGIILGFIWQFIFIKSFESIAGITGFSFMSGWLSTTETGFWGLVILYVWQMAGYIMIIYISFLNNIPEELLEAAEIDGANSWQRFWRIKFPMLAPAFTVSLFLTLSGAFKVYDQNMALTAGGPFNSTEMTAMNIYNTAFGIQDMSYAQAKAVVFLIIIVIISVVQIYITRKREVEL